MQHSIGVCLESSSETVEAKISGKCGMIVGWFAIEMQIVLLGAGMDTRIFRLRYAIIVLVDVLVDVGSIQIQYGFFHCKLHGECLFAFEIYMFIERKKDDKKIKTIPVSISLQQGVP